MKSFAALLGLVLVALSPVQAWEDSSRQHVYYNPVLTSSSAPHSYDYAPKPKPRCQPCRKTSHSTCGQSRVSVRPVLTRKVVYTDQCHDRYKSCGSCNSCKKRVVRHVSTSCNSCSKKVERCGCKSNCRVVNNVVKEVNGGAPRYVVNGTVKVCDEPEYAERGAYGNFHWQWRQQDPHYTKTPVYTNVQYGKPTVHTPGRHYRAQQTYYYR